MAGVIELLVARHARAAVSGLCYGRSDVPLTMDAETAARLLLEDPLLRVGVGDVGHLYASPSARCRELAEVLAKNLGIACCVDERLSELDFGEWEQMLYDDIYRVDRERFSAWAAEIMHWAPPGGETGMMMVRRVADWLGGLDAGCAVVITHAGTIRVLRALLDSVGVSEDRHELSIDFDRPVTPLSVERLVFERPTNCRACPGQPLGIALPTK